MTSSLTAAGELRFDVALLDLLADHRLNVPARGLIVGERFGLLLAGPVKAAVAHGDLVALLVDLPELGKLAADKLEMPWHGVGFLRLSGMLV